VETKDNVTNVNIPE